MIKNYLKILVAMVFATNVMAQQISCIKNFDQIVCDKYGDVYTVSNFNIISLKKKKEKISGIRYIKLDYNKNLIGLGDNIFIKKSNNFITKNLEACNDKHKDLFDISLNGDLIFLSRTQDPFSGYFCGPLTSNGKLFIKELVSVVSYVHEPSFNLKSVCADNKGNVWILGNLGLAKYDGSSFTYYNTGNTPNYPGSTTSMQCDTLGNIWIGSKAGLVKFDGSNWLTYNTSNSGLVSNDILNISLSNDYNSIWIGTVDGFSLFNGKEWKNFNNTFDEQIPLKLSNLSMSEDTNRNLWFSSGGKGYVLCKKINQTILSTNIIKALACDNEIIIQTPFKASIFSWSTGDTTSSLKVKTAGEYSVLIFDSLGCPYSKSITINSTDLKLEQPSICMVTTEN